MNIETIKSYKKIVIWGGGNTLLNTPIDDLEIAYIVDNDQKKWGSFFKEIKVEAPEKLLQEDMSKICIIIFSIYWREIIVQIEHMKITCKVILPSMISPNPFIRNNIYKRSFALFAEDAVIKGIMSRYGVEIRHYVDIGANHPINGNATYLFYLEGASGCLVEPNCVYMDVLKQSRPRDVVCNFGIAGKDSDGKICEYFEIKGIDTRNTFSKETAQYYVEKGYEVYTKFVKLMSLNSLLEYYGKRVDYINIDVEGLEYDILKDFDFKKYCIPFFNIEKGNMEIKELMGQQGYEIAAETPSNWIFVQNGKIRESL